MATNTATHGAAAIRQIEKIVVGGTWAATETLQARMGSATTGYKDLIVTIGNDNSTTQVATAIRDAWNAGSRLDSEGNTDATSNFGGQEFGEFIDGDAYIDPDETSTVYIRSRTAGVPFTVTFTETSASGTLTQTTPQAATGPWHWDDADNWDLGAVPADTNVLRFINLQGANVGFKYNFPASLEASIAHYMSYSGPIGLPLINVSNGKPYIEYRQRHLALDLAAAPDISHVFGLGAGPGSPLINIVHTGLPVSVLIHNTGQPQVQGQKALNIACSDNTSDITILNGSVDFGSQFSVTAAWQNITQRGGDTVCVSGHKANATVEISGGRCAISSTLDIATIRSFGGILRLDDFTGSVVTSTMIAGGTLQVVSSTSLANLQALQGEFNLAEGSGSVTISEGSLRRTCRFIDPYSRAVTDTDFLLSDDPSPDWVFGAAGGGISLVCT